MSPADPAGTVFAALADSTRRAVFLMIGDRGPLTATQLADELPVSRQAITRHLDTLRAAGLVDSSKDGRDVRYVVQTGPLEDAGRWIEDTGRRWDRRLAALRRRADQRRR